MSNQVWAAFLINVRFLIVLMQSSLQPARLNVFKNDQDTWDYTNPNLSGQGNKQSPILPSPLFSSSFPLMPLYGMVRVLCLRGYCLWSQMNGCFFFFLLLSSVFRGSIPATPSQSSCIFSPHSRLKVRAWGATSRAANLNSRLMHAKSPPTHQNAGAPFFT